jgi:NACHT N-terminal Helical domain 1/NACHT domain
MARTDRTASAMDLAAAVTKLACTIWIGPQATAVAGTISDVLRPHVANAMQRERLVRVFSQCTEIAARKLLSIAKEAEFRAVTQNECEAAIFAVRKTMEKADIDKDKLIQEDLIPERVLRLLKPTQNVVLKQALLSEGAQELYERMLAEACRYLVEMVRTFPTFKEDALSVVLQRQTVMIETLNRILRLSATRPASGFAADYYTVLEHKLDRMELFGVTLSDQSSRIYPLTVSYVNLTLLEWDTGEDDATPTLRAEEALAGKSRMLVIGEAGSGKTTLLRWIAVKACRSDFTGPLNGWNDCTPFFLQLRTFADGNFPPPERFLNHIAPVVASEMPVNWVHEKLRSGRALVLVDGLDEVAPGEPRDAARTWLEELIAAFPSAHYIVTSRPAAASEQWTQLSEFSVAAVQPMDVADVRRFVKKWHDAMRLTFPGEDEEEQGRIGSEERALLAAIDEDRLLRSLTENPLLCALLCALNRDRRGNLPRQRMAIYQAALAMLLERRDIERKVERTIPYTANDLTILLQDLAYWLLKNGWSDVALKRAEKQLARSMLSLRPVGMDASTLLPLLLERSGLLRSSVEGHVDFVHRTFQEYLASKAAMDNDDVGQLIERATDDQWHDVIVMAAGHARPRQAAELLRGILRKAEGSPAGESLRTLSVACLQTVQQLEPKLRDKIQQVAVTLIPPKTREVAEAIVYAGPGMLDLLMTRTPKSLEEASAYVRTASLIGGIGALRLIGEVAKSFEGLEDDLTRAWSYFPSDTYAREVLSHAKLDAGLVITDQRLMQYVATLTTLKRLEVAELDIQSLLMLGKAPPNVTTLVINRCPLLSLRGAENWDKISHLELAMTARLPDLAAITKLASLEVVELSFGIGRILRLDALAELPRLRSLRLHRMDHIVVDLTPFRSRSGLTINVPETAVVEGAEMLGPGSRLMRTQKPA